MHERHPFEKSDRDDLEERLHNYYGPALPEEPLPSSSWHRLQMRLERRESHGRRSLLSGWNRRYRGDRARPSALPSSLQEAFQRVASQAHIGLSTSLICCTFRARGSAPTLAVSRLRRHAIRLILPTGTGAGLTAPELDVLVASGLARYASIRRPSYTRARLLLLSAFPLLLVISAGILLWLRNIPLLVPALGVPLCCLYAAIFWLLGKQARRMVREADSVMVQWIGRARACQGLHALAARSRHPARRSWNDLSLTERIAHVCGTPAAQEEEQYTMAR